MPTFFKFLFSGILLGCCLVVGYFFGLLLLNGAYGAAVVCASLMAMLGYMTFQAIQSFFFKK